MIVALCLTGLITPLNAADFGRSNVSIWERQLWPRVGAVSAWLRRTPKSGLDFTDAERDMRKHLHIFLSAPHQRQWFLNGSSHLQRHGIIPPADHTFSVNSYHSYLRSGADQSATARYHRLHGHVMRDVQLLNNLMPVVGRVLRSDELRYQLIMSPEGQDRFSVNPNPYLLEHSLRLMPRNMPEAVHRRLAENRALIDWFLRALEFRAASYRYALEHLSLETPDALAGPVHRDLLRFEDRARAMSADFGANAYQTSRRAMHAKPSRLRQPNRAPFDDQPIPQK